MAETILDVIKNKGEGDSLDRSFLPQTQSREEMDMEAMLQSQPIPGESLTNSPENPMPFETAPEFTDTQEFIDHTFIRLTEEEILGDLLEVMRKGIPVETIAHKYLMGAFGAGEITPDLVLVCIEPVIYMLIALGTHAEVDMVLYPEEDVFTEDEQKDLTTKLFRETSADMKKVTDEDSNGRITIEDLETPVNIPTSLLQKSKDAVEKLGG